MTRCVLIAPVGWYEKRLLTSIYRSGADKIYLIIGKNGPYETITTKVAERLREALPPSLDVSADEIADFRVYTDVLKTFAKIIEMERKADKKARIIVDITSSTKDGAIAASLVARLYDVSISYIPRGEKEKWIRKLGEKDPDEILKTLLKDDVDDPGGKYIRYKITSTPILKEKWMAALEVLYENGSSPMRKLVKKIIKKTGESKKMAASQRYWGRVFHDLEDELFVELHRVNRHTCVELTDVGKAFTEGVLKGKGVAK